VGKLEGFAVGVNVGSIVGTMVGCLVVGTTVGRLVGDTLGFTLGLLVGHTLGLKVGNNVGLWVGLSVGTGVGLPGNILGRPEGCPVGTEGIAVGDELEGVDVLGNPVGTDDVGIEVKVDVVEGVPEGIDEVGLEDVGKEVGTDDVGCVVGKWVGQWENREFRVLHDVLVWTFSTRLGIYTDSNDVTILLSRSKFAMAIDNGTFEMIRLSSVQLTALKLVVMSVTAGWSFRLPFTPIWAIKISEEAPER
jgi:hypothetical protein